MPLLFPLNIYDLKSKDALEHVANMDRALPTRDTSTLLLSRPNSIKHALGPAGIDSRN